MPHTPVVCRIPVKYIKSNLQAWRNKLEGSVDPECRKIGRYAETGKHRVDEEGEGSRWGYVADLVETFFSKLDLC